MTIFLKDIPSKNALRIITLCASFLSALSMGQAGEPIPIAMTADRWQAKENAEFLRELGFYHGLMRLNSGRATLKDVTFSDGTIEFDVNTIGRGMPGIAFRRQDEDNFELVYLRPDPACPAFSAAFSTRRQLVASRSGTCFRDIKRGLRSARTGGTISSWSYSAGE